MNPADSDRTRRLSSSALLGRALDFGWRERGAAVVEFAVVLPVLLVLIFGSIDFGLFMNDQNDATHLANEGARLAAVLGSQPLPGGSSSICSYISSQLDLPKTIQGATVNVSSTTGLVGDPVTVTVTGTYKFIPFLKLGSAGIKGTSTMRLEQPLAAGC